MQRYGDPSIEQLLPSLPNAVLFESAKEFVADPSGASLSTQLALAAELRRRRFYITEDAVLHAAASQIRGDF